ncbi:hypothetical protein NOR51B_304 [Luminiphilus syltensis NOR5-1B]|uniref:FAD/NAD(P)-binding domain-containing protein n=1 Tax=Luminiphilus syltensis NOR5-1B TaxID=565045 RepID=B8KXS2_9GAMM|nr:FAD-dependent oxidoreductase [Luminiphilus syltensis]EED34367.1 hypothetical protein NOR51B_304 [Luminiphilus syltensis NOR5-1B]
MKPKVVVLGGGFAGLSCALRLPASEFDVVLVDQRAEFEFLPAIHELLSGMKTKRALRLPLKPILETRGHQFRRGIVGSIDTGHRCVVLQRGRIAYDYLVLALGAADADFGVAGVSEHAFRFKSVDQCAALGRQVARQVRDRGSTRITIVGGGLEGVEACGELLRAYRNYAIDIRVIERSGRLLPAAPKAVSEHLHHQCEYHGVTLVLGEEVRRVMPKTIELGNGKRRRSDVTIWTGGAIPKPLFADSGLSYGKNWVDVTERLQHCDDESIYVLGDSAGLPQPLSKQAYHAIDMGEFCADDLQRRIAGRRRRVFKPSKKPQLVAFGDLDTLLIGDRMVLAGPSLGVLKEAIYQGVMVQLDGRAALPRLKGLVTRGVGLPSRLDWPVPSLSALGQRASLKKLA